MGTMKNRGTCCNKDLVLQFGSGHVGIWADEATVTNGTRVPGTTSNNGVLHNNAVSANSDGAPALADDKCPMHYARTRADRDVAADCRIRRNPSGLRCFSCVFYEHFVLRFTHDDGCTRFNPSSGSTPIFAADNICELKPSLHRSPPL
jgi:hypothetical protein